MAPELAAEAGIDLDRVNAIFQGTRRLSQFIGPMLAGFLIAIVGTSNVLWVNAVVFGLSVLVTLLFIPDVSHEEREVASAGSFRENMLFGFRFLQQNRLLLWLAVTVGLMNFLDAPLATVQIPALVQENYGGAGRVGVLLGAHGAGSLLGSLAFGVLAGRFSRRKMFIGSFGAVGVVFLALATAPVWILAIATMVLMGILGGPLNPILMSIRQERVPLPYRARVFGTTTAIAFIAIPLGQLIGGFAIQGIGVQWYTAAVAVIYIGVVVTMWFNPVLHEMDHRLPKGAGIIPAG
jgi:MFS family permease